MQEHFIHIISRAQAKSLGLRRFFTGLPCTNNHISERFCNEGKCCECNRLRCSERHERICAGDRLRSERILAKNELAMTRKSDRLARSEMYSARKEARRIAIEYGQVHYHGISCKHDGTTLRYTSSGGCVECLGRIARSQEKKLYDKSYADENKDRIRGRSAEYAKANRAKVNATSRRWSLANPEKRKTISMNYTHRRRAQEERGVSTADLSAWVCGQPKICYWCGAKSLSKYHVDHYYPLSKGGAHEISNLVISCPPCNLRKSAKDPIAWAQENGRLI